MKYCTKCGKELVDEAQFCPSCGTPTRVTSVQSGATNTRNESGLELAIRILLIISCVLGAFAIIPLIWRIPMTMWYFDKKKNNESVSLTFKICSIFFLDLIAGILMLIDDGN